MTEPRIVKKERPSRALRLRNYLLTGLAVLTPTVVTGFVFFKLLDWVDNLLGRYLRFAAVDYRRIPGLGLIATLLLLVIIGWMASWLGGRGLLKLWERFLTGIPGVRIVYGSTKALGEALFSHKNRGEVFRQVVLVPWPHPGMYRLGFLTGVPTARVRDRFTEEVEAVFVPNTANPTSGFFHYVPKSSVIYLDWPVQDGLKVVISGGVWQPGEDDAETPGREPAIAETPASRA